MTNVPKFQVRACFDEQTITVYQAYSAQIAKRAVATGRFVAPFKRSRMTWIKPSFLWMMYRSGWASKPDQERVLAIDITREGWEWALGRACLSSCDPDVYADRRAWSARLKVTPVRVQWDPERAVDLSPLPYRAIQVGLRGAAVDRYVDDWTVRIRDVTDLAHAVHALVRDRQLPAARRLLPVEQPYPLPQDLDVPGVREPSPSPVTASERFPDSGDCRWPAIDDLIIEGRIIHALHEIRGAFGCSLQEALELFEERYEVSLQRSR